MGGAAGSERESSDKPEIHGGFAMAHWCGNPEVEAQVKRDLHVTIRCIPLEGHHRHFEIGSDEGKCVLTGKPSRQRVIWAKAY
jgi:prolyl-tRNA synthetase